MNAIECCYLQGILHIAGEIRDVSASKPRGSMSNAGVIYTV